MYIYSTIKKNNYWSANQQLNAGLTGQSLLVQAATAIGARAAYVIDFGEFPRLRVNLLRQLSSGRQDESDRPIARLNLLLVENVNNRWPEESHRFPAACLGNTNYVAATQRSRYGLSLDWRGLRVLGLDYKIKIKQLLINSTKKNRCALANYLANGIHQWLVEIKMSKTAAGLGRLQAGHFDAEFASQVVHLSGLQRMYFLVLLIEILLERLVQNGRVIYGWQRIDKPILLGHYDVAVLVVL